MRYPAILAAALAAAAFAVPAAAESAGVAYADLDLSTKAGQDLLERRIDSAAREACSMDEIRTGRFTPSTAQRRCYRETKASVHARVAAAIARNDRRGG